VCRRSLAACGRANGGAQKSSIAEQCLFACRAARGSVRDIQSLD